MPLEIILIPCSKVNENQCEFVKNQYYILIVVTCFVSCYSAASLNSDDNLCQHERDYAENAINAF